MAVIVLYVDISNDSSFGHFDHQLTDGFFRTDFDFEDRQHISLDHFTDVVDIIHCSQTGVCHKVHLHVECGWQREV